MRQPRVKSKADAQPGPPRAALVLLAALVASACSSGSISDPAASTNDAGVICSSDFASLRATIFLPSCTGASCHSSADRAAGLDLQSAAAEMALVGAQAGTCAGSILVRPGNAEQSLLYQKVAGSTSCGARMPLGASSLEDAKLRCLAGWINGFSMTESGSPSTGPDAGSQPDAASCAGGLTLCSGTCVDFNANASHCGSCGTACGAGQVCNAGACTSGCGSLTQCGSSCVDVQTNVANCGQCGNACAMGATCTSGQCACSANEVVCSGACRDLLSDPNNCGQCGRACALGQSCTSGTCRCGSTTVSFASAVQPVFTASCSLNGCHGGMAAKENLNLTTGQAYASLVNVNATECTDGRKRVAPGDPSTSYLMQKLRDLSLCGPGTQMPKTGQSIPQAQIQTIADWICEGAPNN